MKEFKRKQRVAIFRSKIFYYAIDTNDTGSFIDCSQAVEGRYIPTLSIFGSQSLFLA